MFQQGVVTGPAPYQRLNQHIRPGPEHPHHKGQYPPESIACPTKLKANNLPLDFVRSEKGRGNPG